MSVEQKYQIENILHKSNNTIVYRAIRKKDQKPVVIKVLNDKYPSAEKIARFKYEYEIINSLNSNSSVKAFEMEKYENSPAIIMDDFGGEPLKSFEVKELHIGKILNLFVKIATVLKTIHDNNIIHKDITPANILWNQQSNEIRIIDFGISTKLSSENAGFQMLEVLEGTLPYISPEQTGRINRSVDYRSDFYSLGITFYELISGELPFRSNDILEIVHSHIAKKARSISEIRTDIPEQVSRVIMKLISKMAEERYQSINGLIYDLKKCADQYNTMAKIEDFELGEMDFNDRFTITQKLYGREDEINTLLKTCDRVGFGRSELLLITGHSGIGKSALINEVHRPITEKKGYFTTGKFDQYKSNVPYFSLIQAFQDLIRQILTENDEEIEDWKDKILEAVGKNGSVITTVIPELELIIGKQEEVAELSSEETQNRFNIVFKNFVQAFSSFDKPLVVFLDDLQWADLPSIQFIESMMKNSDVNYILFIGAYRDNEVNEFHPLSIMLKELRNENALVNSIHLSPLQEGAVNLFVSDTLDTTTELSETLSKICYEKTGGNPFFLKQFLHHLYDRKLLTFDNDSYKWIWNIFDINEIGFTDNVIELMIGKIKKLSEDAQEILKLSSCVGNTFDINTLHIVSKKGRDLITNSLWEALKVNLIAPISESYKFAKDLDESHNVFYKFQHDRIQQATYSMIEIESKKEIHYNIGKLLNETLSDEEKKERIFDIVNHLNQGIDLIETENDKKNLINLNLEAGKRAVSTAAYDPAYKYFETGISLLQEGSWNSDYSKTLELYNSISEASFLTKKFDELIKYTQTVIDNSKEILDTIDAQEIRIRYNLSQNQAKVSIEIAKALLKELGLKLPENPGTVHILKYLLKTKISLTGKKPEMLYEYPEMTDTKQLTIMRILSSIAAASYLAEPNLFPIITLIQVHMSVKYGNTQISSEAYSLYGVILCGVLKDYENGLKFGKLAVKLSNKTQNNPLKQRVLFHMSDFISHWKEPIEDVLRYAMDSYHLALENGDLEYAAWALFLHCEYSYYAGKNLKFLTESFRSAEKVLKNLSQEKQLSYNTVFDKFIKEISLSNNTEMFDKDNEMMEVFKEANDSIGFFFIHFHRACKYFHLDDYKNAIDCIENAQEYLESNMSTMNYPYFYFYDSLIRIHASLSIVDYDKKKAMKHVDKNQKQLSIWSKNSPENYKCLYLLVEAERYRAINNNAKAMEYYKLAIEKSQQSNNLRATALANEMAGKFYLAEDFENIGLVFIKDALFGYDNWGAKLIVDKLEVKYTKELASTENDGFMTTVTSRMATSRTSKTGTTQILDLNSIIKAANSLSSEIKLSGLLKEMMNFVIENAGAQKGFFLFEKNGEIVVEAECNVEFQEEMKVSHSIPLEKYKMYLSTEIVNYVYRTREKVILSNASEDSIFSKSEYIKKMKPKSIICIPLVNQGKLVGILYLENNLTSEAFSKDRVDTLNIMSTQLAISLENAKVYSELEEFNKNLEKKVVLRTSELNEKNKKITDSINYAKRIQNSILPDSQKISKEFEDFLLIYLPRDIVSGDFYWYTKIENKLLLASVDCTGHGVPGAMLSMIGSMLLNKNINEKKITDPKEIMEILDAEVTALLQNTEERSNDGMDAAICLIDKDNDSLVFSGSRRSLFYYNTEENVLIESKGVRRSIGSSLRKKKVKFENIDIDLKNISHLYLVTDGFVDQLNESNRVFSTKRLKNIIEAHINDDFSIQKDTLLKELREHEGNMKQTDDITLIGIKL